MNCTLEINYKIIFMKNLFLFGVIAGVVLGVAIYLTSEDDTTLSDELDAINDIGTGADRGFNAMS
jgi:hypothetical protein